MFPTALKRGAVHFSRGGGVYVRSKTPTRAVSVTLQHSRVVYRCWTETNAPKPRRNIRDDTSRLLFLNVRRHFTVFESPFRRISSDSIPSWCRTAFTSASMPSLRHSYTVTVPEEPAAFPLDNPNLRRKSPSFSRSMVVSAFMGLIINQAKVSLSYLGADF